MPKPDKKTVQGLIDSVLAATSAPAPSPTDPEFEQQLALYKHRAVSLYEKLPMIGFGARLRVSIRTWYRLVETANNENFFQARDLAAKKADDPIESLSSNDFRAGRVFEMTRNPLLLTNICLVHRDGGRLPGTRGKLYRATMDVLLEFWRGARGAQVRIGADPGLCR